MATRREINLKIKQFTGAWANERRNWPIAQFSFMLAIDCKYSSAPCRVIILFNERERNRKTRRGIMRKSGQPKCVWIQLFSITNWCWCWPNTMWVVWGWVICQSRSPVDRVELCYSNLKQSAWISVAVFKRVIMVAMLLCCRYCKHLVIDIACMRGLKWCNCNFGNRPFCARERLCGLLRLSSSAAGASSECTRECGRSSSTLVISGVYQVCIRRR